MFQIQSTEILQEARSILYIHKLFSFFCGLKRMALEKTFVSAYIYLISWPELTISHIIHSLALNRGLLTSNIFKCKCSYSILKDFTLTFLAEFYHII